MRLILSFRYEYFLVPEDIDVGAAVNFFYRLIKVNQDGYGKEALYIPEEEIDSPLQIICVHNEQVRQLTPEESNVKERQSLENRVNYLEHELKKTQEKNKELECINKALCKDEDKKEAEM